MRERSSRYTYANISIFAIIFYAIADNNVRDARQPNVLDYPSLIFYDFIKQFMIQNKSRKREKDDRKI